MTLLCSIFGHWLVGWMLSQGALPLVVHAAPKLPNVEFKVIQKIAPQKIVLPVVPPPVQRSQHKPVAKPHMAPTDSPQAKVASQVAGVTPQSKGSMAVAAGNAVVVPTAQTLPTTRQVGEAKGAVVPTYELTQLPQKLGECVAKYPEKARQAGLEGRVLLRVEVLANGHVGDVVVVKGISYDLDEAAVQALQHCMFEPAKHGTQVVGTQIEYTYTFVLED